MDQSLLQRRRQADSRCVMMGELGELGEHQPVLGGPLLQAPTLETNAPAAQTL